MPVLVLCTRTKWYFGTSEALQLLSIVKQILYTKYKVFHTDQ